MKGVVPGITARPLAAAGSYAPSGPSGLAFGLFLVLTAVLFLRPTEIIPSLDGLPIFQSIILACLATTFPWILPQLSPSAIRANPITACVLGVALAVPLSRYANSSGEEALDFGSEFLKVVAYYLLLTAVVDSPQRLRGLLIWLVICLAAHTALALANYHGVMDIPAMNGVQDSHVNKETGETEIVQRLSGVGLFGNPNDLSRILVVGIALTACLLSQWPLAVAPALIGLAGMFGYALTQTFSRGGLVAMVITVLAGLQVRYGGKRTAILALLALPAGLAALGGRQTDLSTQEGTGQQRIQLWLEGFSALRESPFVGIGASRYPEFTGGLGAHNSFVECYVELGLIGGTCFMSAFILAIWQMYRHRPGNGARLPRSLAAMHPFILAVIAGYAAGLLSSSRNYVMPTYLLLGLATVYLQLAVQSNSRMAQSLDGRLVVRLVIISGLMLVVLYASARALVHWN